MSFAVTACPFFYVARRDEPATVKTTTPIQTIRTKLGPAGSFEATTYFLEPPADLSGNIKPILFHYEQTHSAERSEHATAPAMRVVIDNPANQSQIYLYLTDINNDGLPDVAAISETFDRGKSFYDLGLISLSSKTVNGQQQIKYSAALYVKEILPNGQVKETKIKEQGGVLTDLVRRFYWVWQEHRRP